MEDSKFQAAMKVARQAYPGVMEAIEKILAEAQALFPQAKVLLRIGEELPLRSDHSEQHFVSFAIVAVWQEPFWRFFSRSRRRGLFTLIMSSALDEKRSIVGGEMASDGLVGYQILDSRLALTTKKVMEELALGVLAEVYDIDEDSS